MITREQVDLAKVIYHQLEALYEETKNPEIKDWVTKELLGRICGDVQDLNAMLFKIWRDVR